jgi:hypothetical protein
MWSDNESEIDLLGFRHFVSCIASIINNESLLPATIGVYGDWGIGKSSLLKMAQAELKKDSQVLVLSFNGWLFENYEDAKTALMGTVLDEIVANKTLTAKAKTLSYKLLKRINVMQLFGAAVKATLKAGLAYSTGGLPALGITAGADALTHVHEILKKAEDVEPNEIDKFFKEDSKHNLRRSIREFRQDFKELLEETKIKTLVVIIDDLDRCMPDTIIETLEAIKLFLFVPRTAFILGADERLVKYAVRRRFPELPGERVEVGRDYLEKLIQFDIRVPPLGRAELETYVNLLFFTKAVKPDSEEFKKAQEYVVNHNPNSILEVRFNLGIAQSIFNQKLPPGLEEDLSLAQRISPVLAVGLNGNPRQCKRFLNKLVMRLEMAKSRSIQLKQRILAKLMLLEYFKPEFFRQLAELQAEQQGCPRELTLTEQRMGSKSSIDDASDSQKHGNGKVESEDKAIIGADTRRKSTTSGDSKISGEKSSRAFVSAEELPSAIATWTSDDWMKEWLESSPFLADEDLRPYFFFSRDTLGSLGGSVVQRMTPKAQEIITELFQDSEAVRNNALKKANDLNQAEAAAVFEAISEKVRLEEDLGAETSALNRLCDWIEVRPELFSQFVTILNSLPDGNLPVWSVVRIENLAKGDAEKNLVRQIQRKWAESDSASQPLKNAASRRLKKI